APGPVRRHLVPASGDPRLQGRGFDRAARVVDLVAGLGAAVGVHRLAASDQPGHLALVLAIGFLAATAHDVLRGPGPANFASNLVMAARSALTAMIAIMVAVPFLLAGSGLLLGVRYAGMLVVGRVVLGALGRAIAARLVEPMRVVLLCDPAEEDELRADLAEHAATPAHLMSWDELFPRDPHDFLTRWLPTAGRHWDPTQLIVVIGRASLDDNSVAAQISHLEDLGARITSIDGYYERYLGRTLVRPGEGVLLLAESLPHGGAYGALKRLTDLVVALLLLPVVALLAIPVGLAIRLTSRGPVLFAQRRIGLDGHEFTLWKFRTMVADAEVDGPRFAGEDDPRITAVGRFLRRARLDELPQVWNVLRGEMSFVGPRPERPEFVAELNGCFPAFDKRLLVRPGITGWAQVNEPYASSLEDHRRKLERDLYYIRHRSPTLDLQCMVRTVRSMTSGGGQ
ncbi:MAG: exopolysaccharide biosynthesis polyprenyl glycosylphosphotransferase, partial [Acidimicrobiia bacterium]|nr:exopolysaccharide biosynthesis polyprenyl glycosylphosphotransferase [Acidimicrobiia bacterium]